MIGIRTKLVATFLAISAFFGIMGLVLYAYSAVVVDSFNDLNEHSLPELIALRQMITESLVIYSISIEFTVEDDQEELQGYLEEIQEAKDEYSDSFQTYSSIAAIEGRSGQEVSSVTDQWNTFVLNSDALINQVQAGSLDEEEIDVGREKLERSQEAFANTIDQIVEKQLLNSQEVDAMVDSNQSLMFTFILITLVSSVAFSMGLGIAVSHRITKPLLQLKNAAIQVAKGNYDTKISIFSKDELGELATHFEKMKRELGEKENMQREFLMVASHELRTPIQPILSFAELGLKGTVSSKVALENIQHESLRLRRLADDIFDVTKIESGKLKYQMMDVDVRELINDVIAGFRSSASGVTLVEDMSQSSAEMKVWGDSFRLRQVLSNIIGNAIKFTKHGTIRIVCKTLSPSGVLEIKIIDSGPGIPEELMPKLFGKFMTKDIDGNNKHGTGLGLFICKAIVEAHAGEIQANNNADGQGATFTIRLPLESDNAIRLRASSA
jgi:signal transduction histidine kinase